MPSKQTFKDVKGCKTTEDEGSIDATSSCGASFMQVELEHGVFQLVHIYGDQTHIFEVT